MKSLHFSHLCKPTSNRSGSRVVGLLHSPAVMCCAGHSQPQIVCVCVRAHGPNQWCDYTRPLVTVEPTSLNGKLCAARATRYAASRQAWPWHRAGNTKQQAFQSRSRYAASHAKQSCISGLPAPSEVNPEKMRREISPAKLVSVLLKGAGDPKSRTSGKI